MDQEPIPTAVEEAAERGEEKEEEMNEEEKAIRLPKKGITSLISRLAGGDNIVISNEFKEAVDKVAQTFMFYVLTK